MIGLRLAPVFALAPFSLLIAACGSSPTVPSTTTPTTTTAPATTSTAPGGSGVTTAAACSTGVLVVSATFGGTAAGSSYETVSVKNTGPAACALDGYPKYEFFGPSAAGGAGAGPALTISAADGGPSPSSVTLASGGSADSIVIYSNVVSGGSVCPTIASALLTPPGSGEGISFPISFAPCGAQVKVYAFGPSGSESP